MTNSTQQIQFRDEYIQEFELKKSLIKDRVSQEIMIQGEVAKFLVAGSGGATARTRGANGKLVSRSVSRTQKSATLKEAYDKQELTGFDIFGSQGDLKKVMMDNSMSVIYRDIDSDILTTLSGATVTTGAAQVASLSLVNTAITTLGNAKAGGGADTMTFLITPSFHSYLTEIDAFSSADYVDTKAFMTDATSMFTWRGHTFIEHPDLDGVGTASATCYAFNKSAVGHAYSPASMTVNAGYQDWEDLSYVVAKCYHGSTILQNSGIVKIVHNDSGNSL